LSGCISGQDTDYFSCQKMINAPAFDGNNIGGGVSNGSGGGGGDLVASGRWQYGGTKNEEMCASIQYRPFTAK
jgi:hypothetical protein